MIQLIDSGVYLLEGNTILPADRADEKELALRYGSDFQQKARKGTITYSILEKHNISGDMESLQLKFDALASHDLTYVGVIQTARASGLTEFPIPYILTNCHNSLCAVGGTLNEDDHMFGLSAAKKYGGIYVPAHQAVIHSYMREEWAACGRMILGSDSHTRYGALGTMGIGEGGGELAKQLLCKTYDISRPEVVCVRLTGNVRPGVGPQDVSLAILRAVFANGFVKNKVMEFVGDGIDGLSADFRNGIDVMTTETACLSSIWRTDEVIADYYETHGRSEDFCPLNPAPIAYYDSAVCIDLSQIEPMIALPFHPSNAYTIAEFKANTEEILKDVEEKAAQLFDNTKVVLDLRKKIVDGRFLVDQGVVAGCAGGTYENIAAVHSILKGAPISNDSFALSLYPASQPVLLALVKNGIVPDLIQSGAVLRTAFCGPCFGAGDVPANGSLSVRHTTRNFPNREGSKPANGQAAGVALMDARSIAATALNGGVLTAATELPDISYDMPEYTYDNTVYKNRVYNGFGHSKPDTPLRYGPNITDWPEIDSMPEHWLLGMASVIHDPVTTTDELIPSGDASSYRSNPKVMAEFTLSRKDPAYVGRAKAWHTTDPDSPQIAEALRVLKENGYRTEGVGFGSVIYAVRPGDGSAREQAASCQRVLGGCANIAQQYATRRYRSNLLNWGMLPLLNTQGYTFLPDDVLFLPDIRRAVAEGALEFDGFILRDGQMQNVHLAMDEITADERSILLAGCLMNFYRS